jgi:hypothetical protein
MAKESTPECVLVELVRIDCNNPCAKSEKYVRLGSVVSPNVKNQAAWLQPPKNEAVERHLVGASLEHFSIDQVPIEVIES